MRQEFWGVLVAAVGILGAAGVSSPVAEASQSIESDGTSIIVRTFTEAASASDIRTARRTASAILGRAGIHVEWFECALPGEVIADACNQPPQWNELLVRVVSAGAVHGPRDVDTLGFAIVDPDLGVGSLATVYADRVAVLAQGAGVDAAELLGRTMAHEVGHLLLGTNRHAARGLMRASWSSADLRRNRETQWLFGVKEGEVMRSGIASRFRSLNRYLKLASACWTAEEADGWEMTAITAYLIGAAGAYRSPSDRQRHANAVGKAGPRARLSDRESIRRSVCH